MADRTREREDERVDATPATPEPEEPTGPKAVPDGDDEATETATDASTPADADGSAPADAGDEPDWQALADEDPRSRAELLAELTAAEARRDEYLDDVRRARAEFENYRKRVMRESVQQRSIGRGEVVEKLLDVLDDFDRTIQAADSSGDALRQGVELVHRKLGDTLRQLGVTRIDEPGATFDPEKHEAVQRVEAEDELDEPIVDQVLRAGYELDGRVVRAAMVVVRQ